MVMQLRHNIQGSMWYRWDLHFHSPTSYDYQNKGLNNQAIISAIKKAGISVVAITDHHGINIQRIKELQTLAGDTVTILPGIELRDDHGGSHLIHYIGIFPEDCDLSHVWTKLQGKLGLTTKDIKDKGGDDGVYVPIEDGAQAIHDLNGIVSIHAGTKSNSIEEIKNVEEYKERIKFNILNEHVDLLEIGNLKDQLSYRDIVFKDTGLDKPLILCSDNHNVNQYDFKGALWIKADPTYRGLLMAIQQHRDRVFIGEKPLQLSRIEKNRTKYVKSVSFSRKPDCPIGETWFFGEVPFNPGLVAIIGNKGSGKSALSDTIGLLGGTKNFNSFSFLTEERFKHPISGRACHFEATLTWESGEPITRSLDSQISLEEVERVKYLPQNYVERVCNELGKEDFEQELKSVIFSHVPDIQRLGHNSLDRLLQYKNEVKQKRIDSLIKQLRDVSRTRASLEAENDPSVARAIKAKIKQAELEIRTHDEAKPKEVLAPSDETNAVEANTQLLADLAEKAKLKEKLLSQIKDAQLILKIEERRLAVAMRLLEKLDNFQKDFTSFQDSLKGDANEIGINIDNLLTLTLKAESIHKVKQDSTNKIAANDKLLNDIDSPGLLKQLVTLEEQIQACQQMLDEPNRLYQKYLKELLEWQNKHQELLGDENDSESLTGLKASLAKLSELPVKILEQKNKQSEISKEILVEKLAQVSILRELYEPVQSFINSHELAKDKLKLEFRAELVNENFSDSLLAIIAQNKKGSFMGINEGREVAESFVKKTLWQDQESVQTFLQNIDEALHNDKREKTAASTQLKDQMLKGRSPEDVYDLLFGLEYIRARYVLRWEGKDLSMLSPGERGTLLLVFYLLIEKGEIPIVIDQPEGNLDNLTIANNLVDCIKAARNRRQIFIVTHNPNLAVVCDADQIIYSKMDKVNGNSISYVSGALENPKITEFVTDVLEGTLPLFNTRGAVYEVAENIE